MHLFSRICAVNNIGESDFAESQEVLIKEPIPKPQKPAYLNVQNISADAVDLTWSATDSENTSGQLNALIVLMLL